MGAKESQQFSSQSGRFRGRRNHRDRQIGARYGAALAPAALFSGTSQRGQRNTFGGHREQRIISVRRRFLALVSIAPELQGLIAARWLRAVFGASLFLALAGSASAQAPAGPMTPPPGTPPELPPPSVQGNAPARIGGKPNLAGLWKLNRSDSDDPRQKLQQANSNSRGQGGRGGWGGPGGPGGQGGPGGPMGGGQRSGRGQDSDGQSDAGSMLSDLSYLTISQTTATVKVLTDSSHLLAQYPMSDQGNSNTSDNSQNSKTATAQWQGDQLVVVTPGANSGKTTRTFEMSSDGSQLYLTTRMEGGRLKQPVTFRLVYDPSNSSDD